MCGFDLQRGHGGVNVFHVCLNFGVVYGVGVVSMFVNNNKKQEVLSYIELNRDL